LSAIRRVISAWRKNAPEIAAFFNGGLPAFVRQRSPQAGLAGVPVFCFHVVDAPSFQADCEFLHRNRYRTLTVDEVIEVAGGRRACSGREVALTFDDGPRNFHDVAFPLLRKYGLRATIFIAPGLHADHYGAMQSSPLRPMSWDEIRAVHASGLVSVQSHTLQSQSLAYWPTAIPLAGVDPRIEASLRRPPLQLADDLRAARELIEKQVPGARVRHLCFPAYLCSAEAGKALQPTGHVAGWGGLLPGHPMVRNGDGCAHLPRLPGILLRRLPGDGRLTLAAVARLKLAEAREGRRRRTRLSHAIEGGAG
jgi:hypothetical protein